MKRLFYILLTLSALSTTSLSAKEPIHAYWLAMPDTLCPYLTLTQRQNMLMQVWNHQGKRDSVDNQLDGRSYLDTLSNSYLKLTHSPLFAEELSFLGDTLVLTHNLCAPKCATFIRYYDLDWHFLGVHFSPFPPLSAEEQIPYAH